MEHLDSKGARAKLMEFSAAHSFPYQNTRYRTYIYICRISLALVSGALLCRVVPVRYCAACFRYGIVPLASGALIAYVSAHLLDDHHILPINAS
jgi:hypothetical protein